MLADAWPNAARWCREACGAARSGGCLNRQVRQIPDPSGPGHLANVRPWSKDPDCLLVLNREACVRKRAMFPKQLRPSI